MLYRGLFAYSRIIYYIPSEVENSYLKLFKVLLQIVLSRTATTDSGTLSVPPARETRNRTFSSHLRGGSNLYPDSRHMLDVSRAMVVQKLGEAQEMICRLGY